jgi:hypothetical protein
VVWMLFHTNQVLLDVFEIGLVLSQKRVQELESSKEGLSSSF